MSIHLHHGQMVAAIQTSHKFNLECQILQLLQDFVAESFHGEGMTFWISLRLYSGMGLVLQCSLRCVLISNLLSWLRNVARQLFWDTHSVILTLLSKSKSSALHQGRALYWMSCDSSLQYLPAVHSLELGMEKPLMMATIIFVQFGFLNRFLQ